MENLFLNLHPELIYYPVVDFNAHTGVLTISGESYMEDTYKFYEPILNWLRKFVPLNLPFVFNIKLTYFNTSTSRFLLEFLEMMAVAQRNGQQVAVYWYYKKSDPDMVGEINDYIAETGINIKSIVVDN